MMEWMVKWFEVRYESQASSSTVAVDGPTFVELLLKQICGFSMHISKFFYLGIMFHSIQSHKVNSRLRIQLLRFVSRNDANGLQHITLEGAVTKPARCLLR